MKELKVEEAARAAARDFIREDRERRYERARRLSEFETRVIDEAEALGEYARWRDTRTSCILVGSYMEDTLKADFIEQWNIASGLNWLPPALQNDADLIRKVRNEMAHNYRVHLLDQEPLLSWANDMKQVEKTWLRDNQSETDRELLAARLS